MCSVIFYWFLFFIFTQHELCFSFQLITSSVMSFFASYTTPSKKQAGHWFRELTRIFYPQCCAPVFHSNRLLRNIFCFPSNSKIHPLLYISFQWNQNFVLKIAFLAFNPSIHILMKYSRDHLQFLFRRIITEKQTEKHSIRKNASLSRPQNQSAVADHGFPKKPKLSPKAHSKVLKITPKFVEAKTPYFWECQGTRSEIPIHDFCLFPDFSGRMLDHTDVKTQLAPALHAPNDYINPAICYKTNDLLSFQCHFFY